jgi:lanosterol synthase
MQSYDVAIVGGGPVGCATALAFAQRGARVLVCEAQPRACQRLAGEWLHPPAVDILEQLGARDAVATNYDTGRGFVVFPDDGGEPMVLPYRGAARGASIEHATMVERLRQRIVAERNVEYVEHARVTAIDGQKVTWEKKGAAARTVSAAIVVGAGGRATVAHQALGIDPAASSYSRMAGLLLEDCELPNEGFGHVFLGGPGPVLAYRIDDRHVRVALDVPLWIPTQRDREARLWDAFRHVLPVSLLRAFREALEQGNVAWAANQNRPRLFFGREGLVLVGDAVGHHHPLTAIGMTLGFQDAVSLAGAKSFAAYRRKRMAESRVPEMLAVALYEVFADTADEIVAIRHAVYDLWRRDVAERERTMAYLACQDTAPVKFGGSFVKAVAVAGRRMLAEAHKSGQWRHRARVGADLVERCRWLLAGALRLSDPRPSKGFPRTVDGAYGGALRVSGAKAEVVEHPAARAQAQKRASRPAAPHIALERAVRALRDLQLPDGAWEGEVVWNAMLAAQYAMMCVLTRTPIAPERRERILLQFRRTQLADGTWSMHELGQPYLFMTAVVYVAARLLGVAADDPLLVRARAFIAREGGVVGIPSWGKLWLALAGLYDWAGVNPVLPEVWALPRILPLHPSNYYCHTRLIYLGMASVYGETFDIDPELRAELRRELYPQGYEHVDFERARHQLRSAEIFVPPSAPLKLSYDLLYQLNRRHDPERRAAIRRDLLEHIRFEVRSTDATFLSPVNGLLSMLALWRHDQSDPDFQRALARFPGWMWEDDVDGTRVSGARSASWDTAFAVQALTAAAPHVDATAVLERADDFLASQQILEPQAEGYERFFRVDPTGGYCFAGIWHGWPVSDCTAEALIARLETPVARIDEERATAAVRFILRAQCPDGGFGSYEPFRPVVELEWLNPAEMFGDSMTEHPYVECTASCVAALAAYRARHPGILDAELDDAIARARDSIERRQRPDGSWSGNWGVHFVYGTMFGVRGLLAAGVHANEPAIRKACRFLRARQRPDGGWGERWDACLEDRYVDAPSQVIQTAWALTTLLEAHDPDWDAIERGAHYLASRQRDDGSWPKEDPAGVFFHTALLHYERYRAFFPVWALGLYETRRLERLSLCGPRRAVAAPAMSAGQ